MAIQAPSGRAGRGGRTIQTNKSDVGKRWVSNIGKSGDAVRGGRIIQSKSGDAGRGESHTGQNWQRGVSGNCHTSQKWRRGERGGRGESHTSQKWRRGERGKSHTRQKWRRGEIWGRAIQGKRGDARRVGQPYKPKVAMRGGVGKAIQAKSGDAGSWGRTIRAKSSDARRGGHGHVSQKRGRRERRANHKGQKWRRGRRWRAIQATLAMRREGESQTSQTWRRGERGGECKPTMRSLRLDPAARGATHDVDMGMSSAEDSHAAADIESSASGHHAVGVGGAVFGYSSAASGHGTAPRLLTRVRMMRPLLIWTQRPSWSPICSSACWVWPCRRVRRRRRCQRMT